jgi:hypothetical protein
VHGDAVQQVDIFPQSERKAKCSKRSHFCGVSGWLLKGNCGLQNEAMSVESGWLAGSARGHCAITMSS